MTICDRFTVAVVPFPFVDVDVAKARPALVLSNIGFNRSQGQSILAMITTAAGGRWSSDMEIEDLDAAGLRVRSVVRFKLFTLPNRMISRRIGSLSTGDAGRVRNAVHSIFA